MKPISPNNRILIIDDNPAIHEDFRKILISGSGAAVALDEMLDEVFGAPPPTGQQTVFEIDHAHQGAEGLEKLRHSLTENRPYAMAFVDMRMPPGWDGVETIARLWAEDAALHVVICTAYSDYSWQDIVRRLGNSDRLVILKKPFDSIEVLQLAHTMTRKWEVTRQAGQTVAELSLQVEEQTRGLRQANAMLAEEMAARERTGAALALSENRLARVFQACPLPTAILGLPDHACVQVNDAFLKATGYRRDEMIGRVPWAAGLGIDAAALAGMMDRLAAGEAVQREDCRILPQGGADRAGLLWLEPFDLEAGPHLMVVVQDIAEQKKLEAQLLHAQKVEAIGHLAAGVAHDLNNLLTVILGHTGMQLAKPALVPDLSEALEEVQAAGQRAAALTRQLLAFSRKQVMQKNHLRLDEVISNLESMLRRLIPADLELDFSNPAELPGVFADVCNLEQVILNLAVNARDAMPDGGRLAIHTGVRHLSAREAAGHPDAHAGDYVTLTVSDTGEGMSAATLERIYDPFFTTKEAGKGTGLGLATVFGIVQQHDGWIVVESAPGKGTEFTVFFPVDRGPAPAVAPRAVTLPHAGGREVILLVEDDAPVRALAGSVLKAAGYQVLEAADGPQAVAAWHAYRGTIDLLLTDMVMPGGLSGRDVAERFCEDWPEGRVIYSSGYSVELFGADLNLREGFNYLAKPYLADQLTDAVARARAGPRVPVPSCEDMAGFPA